MSAENHDHMKAAAAFHRRLVAAMASNLKPADVERGDTALVLSRNGYGAAEIADCIDEVEDKVLGRRRDPIRGGIVASAAALALVAFAPPASASILSAEIVGVPLIVAFAGVAWIGAIVGLVAGGLLLNRLRGSTPPKPPVVILRPPCRFLVARDGLVCTVCDNASAPGSFVLPHCSMGGGA